MAYNIADLFEHTVDAVPDRPALIAGGSTLTFAELDARANRFGHYLASQGIGPGDHVGIYAINSEPWVTAMLGCLKVRAVPVNVNYRYVEAELAYLIGNAELVACVFDREYAPRVAAVLEASPKLRTLVHIEDGSDADTSALGSVDFDEACEQGGPERDFPERSADDVYIIYTGGTTGMPKGVMWRHEDIYFALGQGIDALTNERVSSEFTKAEQAAASPSGLVFGVIPPLMHGAAQIATLSQWFIGSTIVLVGKFDAEEVWDLISAHGVNSIIITGDAVARPMIEALEAHPGRWDTTSFISLSSSAALFSQSVKDRFLDRFPNLIITDSIGSTEGGFNGVTYAAKGAKADGGGPTVNAGRDVAVLDDDLAIIPPGDTRVGRLGRTGNIPLGYFNDPAKTAEVFVTAADGRRYSMGGDFARWTEDGRLVMLGRGSVSINSGGEKIFPEEVEAALKSHPAVYDCLVVGVPDERWGQRVAAVVQTRDGHDVTLEDLVEHARGHIAGYKVPRELHVVDEIVRSPSGKPDYPWAKHLAEHGDARVG
ncbi:MAG: acyl-CoA synthetase [Actinobacteria bacterium]|nr:acyl-CoA synthetase [Actinomycetota bacterium]